MQRIIGVGLLCIASASLAWPQSEGEIGAPLPAWAPGMLDIHQIATGRGHAALFILPDGTTLLVDAGAAGDGIPETEPHPDASRTPGAWIARYIERHLPPGVTDLDNALITHFHPDHMGQLRASSPLDVSGTYKLAGITEVGSAVTIHTLFDRGWPDYSYLGSAADETILNYRRFLESRRKRGMGIDGSKPGR